jgi:hypothetical protein
LLRKTKFLIIIIIFHFSFYGFQPADAKSIKIMPMGDSITRGGGYPIGSLDYPTYRYYLYNLLTAAGCKIDFVGPFNGVGGLFNLPIDNPFAVPPDYRDPGYPLFPDQDLAGSTGWKIDAYLSGDFSASKLMQDYSPDVVLVHLGSNDLGTRTNTPEEAVAEIGQLVDLIRSGRSATKIYVAQIIPLVDGAYGRGPGESQLVQEFNSKLPELVKSKNGNKIYPDIVLVDMWTDFDTDTMLAEKTHPNDQGDKEIAMRFYKSLIPWIVGMFSSEFDCLRCRKDCASDNTTYTKRSHEMSPTKYLNINALRH